MEKGFSFESFAGRLRVSRDTIYEWASVHEEFSDAKKAGTELSRLFWENIGVRAASGDTPHNFVSSVYIFTMKNKFKWRDRVEVLDENPSKTEPVQVIVQLPANSREAK